MKLRLGQLPNTEVVKLTIPIPVVLKHKLERYAELHAAEYGRSADVGVFVSAILAHFLDHDRGFQKALRSRDAKTSQHAT